MIYVRMEINLRLSSGWRMDMQKMQNTEMISFECHHGAQAMDSRIRAQATYCTYITPGSSYPELYLYQSQKQRHWLPEPH